MFKVGIVTLSDRCFQGLAVDQSGPLIREQLPVLYQVTKQTILPDEENQLVELLQEWSKTCDLILTTGGTNLVRADGSPKFSMACTLTGAIINTILDPTLIFGFHMGIAGAAWATVIGQVVSGIMVILYLRKFKTVKLTK